MKKQILAILFMSAFGYNAVQAGFFGDAKNWVSGAVKTIDKAVTNTTKEVQSSVDKAVTTIQQIPSAIDKLIADVKTFITALTTEIDEVITTVTASAGEIQTVVPEPLTTNVNNLVNSIKGIPSAVADGSKKPLSDIKTTSNALQTNITSGMGKFTTQINTSFANMNKGITNAENYLQAGDLQNGIPMIVDTFGNSISSLVSTMTTTFAFFGQELQRLTANTTKAIDDLVNNTLSVNWQAPVTNGVAIAGNIVTIFDSLHKAISELNQAVDSIGQNSLNLIGDFTQTTDAQKSLTTLTGQEEGKIKIILDDIKNVENQINNALTQINSYVASTTTQPATTKVAA